MDEIDSGCAALKYKKLFFVMAIDGGVLEFNASRVLKHTQLKAEAQKGFGSYLNTWGLLRTLHRYLPLPLFIEGISGFATVSNPMPRDLPEAKDLCAEVNEYLNTFMIASGRTIS